MSNNVDRTTTPPGTDDTDRARVGATNTNANVNGATGAASTGIVQGQGNNRAPYNPNHKKSGNSFRRDTAKMNGHVFQLHSERKNKSQFGHIVKVLRVYSSDVFKNDIEALTILFTDLVEPKVE